MEDRFKFRVWDKLSKRYWDRAMMYSEGVVNDAFNERTETPLEKEHVIIEQCTGLKDKNGSLIYEGDIVKRNHLRKGEGKTGSIVFDYGRYGISYIGENGTPLMEDLFYFHEKAYDTIEIISNIHEEN